MIDPDLEAALDEMLTELIDALERLADALLGRLPDLQLPRLVVSKPVDEPELRRSA